MDFGEKGANWQETSPVRTSKSNVTGNVAIEFMFVTFPSSLHVLRSWIVKCNEPHRVCISLWHASGFALRQLTQSTRVACLQGSGPVAASAAPAAKKGKKEKKAARRPANSCLCVCVLLFVSRFLSLSLSHQ